MSNIPEKSALDGYNEYNSRDLNLMDQVQLFEQSLSRIETTTMSTSFTNIPDVVDELISAKTPDEEAYDRAMMLLI